MPKSLDPNSKFRMVLACDLDKTPQPAFFVKPLTVGQMLSLRSQSGDSPEMLVDLLMACLVGWENMNGLEFSRENVLNVLAIDEIAEIIEFLTSRSVLSEDERKKSG